jgi:hypothetical protein
MGCFAARGDFKRDTDGLSPPADAGVVLAPERELHEGKNGINGSLCTSLRRNIFSLSGLTTGGVRPGVSVVIYTPGRFQAVFSASGVQTFSAGDGELNENPHRPEPTKKVYDPGQFYSLYPQRFVSNLI